VKARGNISWPERAEAGQLKKLMKAASAIPARSGGYLLSRHLAEIAAALTEMKRKILSKGGV